MSGQNKKLFVLIFIFVAVLVFPVYSFAQNLPIKSSATTVVGTGIVTDPEEPPCEEPPCEEPPPTCDNPPCEEPPPPPPPPEPIPGDSNEEIAYWAEIISPRLSKGKWNLFNKIDTDPPITNRGYTVKKRFYWCTRIIFDSYNLAGIQFDKKNTSVRRMHNYWNKPEQQARGFRTIDYQNNTAARTTILSLKPGDAVMKIRAEGQRQIYFHVVMIDKIEITDPVHGHGEARIIQSNGPRIFYTVDIRGWKFDDPGLSSKYGKMTFGLYRK